MPVISIYLDFKIVMYCFPKEHYPAHIHVYYNNDECVISIPLGDIMRGKLSSRQYKLIKSWIELHSIELMEMWNKASKGQRPGTISDILGGENDGV